MSDSNIGWIDASKMKAALEALRANNKSKAPKAKKPAAHARDIVDLFGEPVPSLDAPEAARGEAFIAASKPEAPRATDGMPAPAPVAAAPREPQRPPARTQPEIPPDQVRAIARAAAPEPQVENPSSLDDAFDRAREPRPSVESTTAGIQDTLAVLRDASPSPVPRHALEELGYESALPELKRKPEPAPTPATPDAHADDEDDALSLPVGDLDLHLRRSISSVASIQPIRDPDPQDDLSEMMVFGEEDFNASKWEEHEASADRASSPASKEPAPRSVPLRASAGFEAVGADEARAPSGAPAPLRGESSPGFTRAPSPAEGQTWERPELLSVTREYRAVTDIEARVDGLSRKGVEPSPRWQGAPEADAPTQPPAHDDEAPALEHTGAYPAVVSAPAAASSTDASSQAAQPLNWRDAPKPSEAPSVLAWLEQMNIWCETSDEDAHFFVADEGGLPLIRSAVAEDDIAIAVAMRQSIASLHSLSHEEAPGFTVYRHSSGRYAHLLWAPSDYGVITVGILSTRVHEDARLAVFNERLVAALNNLPITD